MPTCLLRLLLYVQLPICRSSMLKTDLRPCFKCPVCCCVRSSRLVLLGACCLSLAFIFSCFAVTGRRKSASPAALTAIRDPMGAAGNVLAAGPLPLSISCKMWTSMQALSVHSFHSFDCSDASVQASDNTSTSRARTFFPKHSLISHRYQPHRPIMTSSCPMLEILNLRLY